mgnify:CR=1 FL=1
MLLGHQVSQRKSVNLGVYTLKFHRRKGKRPDEYLYIVTLIKDGKVVESGIFGDYKNAVIYAGQIFIRFR